MSKEEAKIILMCNNVIDFYFAFNNGVISDEIEKLGNTVDEDDDEMFDLNILKKKAIDIVLKELDKKDKVIDLMAEHIFKNSNNLAEYFCNGIPENICEARGNTEEGCRYCIKLYFNKQVEVEEDK